MVQAAVAATKNTCGRGPFKTVGAVITSPKVELASEPTADPGTLANNVAVAGLAIQPGVQMWDSIELAADRLASQPTPRSIVVIAAKPDDGSVTNRDAWPGAW